MWRRPRSALACVADRDQLEEFLRIGVLAKQSVHLKCPNRVLVDKSTVELRESLNGQATINRFSDRRTIATRDELESVHVGENAN